MIYHHCLDVGLCKGGCYQLLLQILQQCECRFLHRRFHPERQHVHRYGTAGLELLHQELPLTSYESKEFLRREHLQPGWCLAQYKDDCFYRLLNDQLQGRGEHRLCYLHEGCRLEALD